MWRRLQFILPPPGPERCKPQLEPQLEPQPSERRRPVPEKTRVPETRHRLKVTDNSCLINVSTSTLSQTIAGMGVVPRTAPNILARRLAHHVNNWVRITRDPRHSPGLLHRLPGHTLPKHQATHPTIQRNSEPLDSGGSRRTPAERGGGRDRGTSRGILFSSQEAEASDKPKGLKLLHTTSGLQDGRDPFLEGAHETRRLVCKARPEGCILHNTHAQQPEEVRKVCAAGQNIRVPLPPIRSLVSSLGHYQDPETSCSTAAGDQTYQPLK